MNKIRKIFLLILIAIFCSQSSSFSLKINEDEYVKDNWLYFQSIKSHIPKYSKVLNLNGYLLTSIEGLSKGTYKIIILSSNPLQDITELSKMEDLEIIDLRRTFVKDISPLCKLRKLKELTIKHTYVKDISNLPKSLRLLYIDRSVSKKSVDRFKKRNRKCKILFDDGFIDSKNSKKGPLDPRLFNRDGSLKKKYRKYLPKNSESK